MKRFFLIISLFIINTFPVMAASVDGDQLPIFKSTACTNTVENGGLGGNCSEPICDDGTYLCLWVETDGCNNSTEKPVGYCNYDSNLGEVEVCCVDKNLEQETIDRVSSSGDNLIGQYFTEDACNNVPGGKCETEDDTWKSGGGTTSCDEGYTYIGVCKAGSDDYYCCTNNEEYLSQFGVGQAGALTQSDYTLLERIPGYDSDSGDFSGYLQALYYAGLVIVALGAVFMIAVGGFVYMASAGNTTAIKKGKGMITDALIGLVIALAAWFILNIINPDLVNLKIDPLPSLTFETNVQLHGGGADTGSAGGSNTTGTASPCTGGLVAMPTEARAIGGAANSQICKDLADKIIALRQSTPDVDWVTTSAIRGSYGSNCHDRGKPNTGNCVDITINGADLHDDKYEPLCEAVSQLSNISVANEASNTPKCQAMKPYQREATTTGDNLHLNFVSN